VKSKRGPRPHWIVAFVLLVVLASMFFVNAYVSAKFVPDKDATRAGDSAAVPGSIETGGPIIDTTKGAVKSYHLPPKTIALTFDDGPDPAWTPKIMDVLRKYHVVGTYFVVGSQVARYPSIVRNLADGGDEIAIHTFTHPNMAELPRWRQELEYSQTQLAIIGATGRKAALLRLPYSSEVDAIDDSTWKLIKQAGELGYLSVMTEADSQDWSRPGIDKVVANATPEEGKSSIVLMHDAGGDRTGTMAAVKAILPELMARYQLTQLPVA
jgi:peptidoglycan/xylan/chitin deacetylase (PgdA/CDA1 family)